MRLSERTSHLVHAPGRSAKAAFDQAPAMTKQRINSEKHSHLDHESNDRRGVRSRPDDPHT